MDYLQISIDNVNPDEVSKKSLKVLDGKLKNFAEHAKFKVNINSVVGGGVANPDEALIIANRALELGFSSTVGVIHDGDGLNKGLTDHEKKFIKKSKQKAREAMRVGIGFKTNWLTAENTNGVVVQAHVICIFAKKVWCIGVRNSAARPAFLCTNTPTKIWSANISPKNGVRRPARFNAFTKSDTSTLGATRKFRSNDYNNKNGKGLKKETVKQVLGAE